MLGEHCVLLHPGTVLVRAQRFQGGDRRCSDFLIAAKLKKGKQESILQSRDAVAVDRADTRVRRRGDLDGGISDASD